MRIDNARNVTIFAGQADVRGPREDASEKSGNAEERKTYYAGDMKLTDSMNPISRKKEEARQQAMKVVGNAFQADRAVDDDLELRRSKIQTLRQENQKYQQEMEWYDGEQERLKASYGVTDGSEEQKELELLRKCQDPFEHATMEERREAAAISERGLTEYQSRVLELDEAKKPYQQSIHENNEQIRNEAAVIKGVRLERLKHSPMVKAQKQAEEILDAASKEIVGMAVEEAKEHMDAEAEKRKEEGEKIEEERREQEELLEERRERREEWKDLVEDLPMEEMLDLNRLQEDVKQEIQDILNKMKLVAEDIKGAAVDEGV